MSLHATSFTYADSQQIQTAIIIINHYDVTKGVYCLAYVVTRFLGTKINHHELCYACSDCDK